MKTSSKIKLFIILGAEFLAVAVILLLVFLAGKETYTVCFDLNGGTLVSGELQQNVKKGKSATAPKTTKEGCYLSKWSVSYSNVTQDLFVEAIWEYETSSGIEFNVIPNSNYCTISGAFDDLQGDVYIGAKNGSLKVLGIDAGAFKNCADITNVYISDGLLSIGAGAFEGCSSLTSVELPEELAILGENAFKDCTALTEIEIPQNIRTIPARAFYNCTALETVRFWEDEKDGETETTEGSTSLDSAKEETEEEITPLAALTSIGSSAFEGCKSLTFVKIPDGVTSIGSAAFRGCTALEEVVLPAQLKAVAINTFYNCKALERIVLPEGLQSIGAGAFRLCGALKEVEIPASVTFLGSSSFRECTALEKVILNEGLEIIYSYAFSDCSALKEMTLPSTITGVGLGAFENTQLVFEDGYPDLEGDLPGLPFDPGIIRPIDPDRPIIGVIKENNKETAVLFEEF